jgi:iron complex transport system ATP-binding protein
LIARALAQDTPLIILDEPTTHLDLLHKVALFKLLKKLTQETGKCILFSTHDIDMAIQLSDEMIMTPEIVLRRTLQFHCKGSFNTLFKDEHIVLMLKKGSL